MNHLEALLQEGGSVTNLVSSSISTYSSHSQQRNLNEPAPIDGSGRHLYAEFTSRTHYPFSCEQIRERLLHFAPDHGKSWKYLDELFLRQKKNITTLEQLKQVLSTAQIHPVKIGEMPYLFGLYIQGEELAKLVAAVLHRTEKLSKNVKATHRILNNMMSTSNTSTMQPCASITVLPVADSISPDTISSNLLTFEEVKDALAMIRQFPVEVPLKDEFERLLHRAESWRKEVVNMKPKNGDSNASSSRAPVPMKKVEALINEGERFPFDFREELDILKDKKQIAKTWLEKLKRSFVPTKSGSSRLQAHRRDVDNGNQSIGNLEKPSLQEMKVITSEGNILFHPLAGEPDQLETELRPGKVVGVNRDLDRAHAVVESAEEWISRARELLVGDDNTDIFSPSLSADEAADRELLQQVTNGEADILEVSSEHQKDFECVNHEEKPDIEGLKQILTDMIHEAEGMPVAMEETILLKAHINSLEWAVKVRPLLSCASSLMKITTGDKNSDDEELQTQEKHGSKISSAKPRLVELQQFAKEIKKIRSAVPQHVQDSLPIKSVPEEFECLQLVKNAENWLGKVKKIMQGNGLRKGVSLTSLEQLLEESQTIAVNFDYELRPINNAVQAAKNWLISNGASLQILHINKSAESDGNLHCNVELGYDDLVSLASSAAQLTANFDEARAIKKLVAQVDKWYEQVNSICEANKKNDGILTHDGAEEDGTTSNLNPKRTKQRKTFKERDSFQSTEAVDEFEMFDENTSRSNENYTTKVPVALISLSEIDALVVTGKSFGINVTQEIDSLSQVKVDAEAWGNEARSFFSHNGTLHRLCVPLAAAFKRMVQIDDSLSKSGTLIFLSSPTNSVDLSNGGPPNGWFEEENKALRCMNELSTAVRELRIKNDTLKIDVQPYSVAIRAIERCILWIEEVYDMVKKKILSRRQINGSGGLLAGADHTYQWEFLNPIFNDSSNNMKIFECPGWADVSLDVVSALVEEGQEIFHGLISAIAEHLQQFDVRSLLSIMNHRFEGTVLAVDLALDKLFENNVGSADDDVMKIEESQAATNTSPSIPNKRINNGINHRFKTSNDQSELETARKSKLKKTVRPINNEEFNPDMDNVSNVSRKGKKRKNNSNEDLAEVSTNPILEEFRLPGNVTIDSDKTTRIAAFHVSLRTLSSQGINKPLFATLMNSMEYSSSSTSTSIALGSKDEELGNIPAFCVLELINYWLRIVLLYRKKLAIAHQWAEQVESLLSSMSHGSSTSFSILSSHAAAIMSLCSKLISNNDESIESTPLPVDNNWEDEETLLDDILACAHRCGIDMMQRSSLKTKIKQSIDWLTRASLIRDGKAKELTMEEMRLFIKEGEASVLHKQKRTFELQYLKGELRKANVWKRQFDRTAMLGTENQDKMDVDANKESNDVDISELPAEMLDELLQEAKTINIDLTEFTDTLSQANKTYCLCRQLYFGQMIGCDTCDDWYHFQCIGLSVSQAERCEKYICIRCTLSNSISQTANMVAQLTNKWMNCVEHFRAREIQLQKASKRLKKDEKEYRKAKAVFDAATTAIVSSATSHGIDAVPKIETYQVLEPTPQQTNPTENVALSAQKELQQISIALQKSQEEKVKLVQNITNEGHKNLEIIRWMQALQEYLWPCYQEKVLAGAPLGIEDAAFLDKMERGSPPDGTSSDGSNSGRSSVQVRSRILLRHIPNLLPYGLRQMHEVASNLNILECIEDVGIALDSFRWMSWCTICLHLIRSPPTTPALRRLIEAAKFLRCADEKIIKLLNGVLQKSSAWKVKAKKYLTQLHKKGGMIDNFGKLHALTLEGNSLPFTSRLKERLRRILDEAKELIHPDKTLNMNSSKDSPEGKRRKRGMGPKSKPLSGSSSNDGFSAGKEDISANTSNTSVVLKSYKSLPKDPEPKADTIYFDSSDEETEFWRNDGDSSSNSFQFSAENAVRTSSATYFAKNILKSMHPSQVPGDNKAIYYSKSYAPLQHNTLAMFPQIQWPPVLTVHRIQNGLPSAQLAGNSNSQQI